MKTILRRVLNIVFTLRTLLDMVSVSRRSPQGLLKRPTTPVSARDGAHPKPKGEREPALGDLVSHDWQ